MAKKTDLPEKTGFAAKLSHGERTQKITDEVPNTHTGLFTRCEHLSLVHLEYNSNRWLRESVHPSGSIRHFAQVGWHNITSHYLREKVFIRSTKMKCLRPGSTQLD